MTRHHKRSTSKKAALGGAARVRFQLIRSRPSSSIMISSESMRRITSMGRSYARH